MNSVKPTDERSQDDTERAAMIERSILLVVGREAVHDRHSVRRVTGDRGLADASLADQLVRGTERVQAYFAATPEQPAWISSLPLGGFLSGSP
jgi:hypothetical protein